MRITRRLAMMLACVAPVAANALAQDDDHAAILALMDRAFAAVTSGDLNEWRDIQLADGTSLSFRPHPDGIPGELQMRMSTNEALLEGGSDSDPVARERWVGEPTVMIRGPIGIVWGEYKFWIDDEVSHCGIDAVDVVKIDGQWKIANWMWTVEPDNCPD